jgi:hypothetical protein
MPCRLPHIEALPSNRQDIQFVVGLVVQDDSALVSYGVGDCHAAVAVLPDLPGVHGRDAALRPGGGGGGGAHLPVVRWEGPVRDYSSFAFVARELGSR